MALIDAFKVVILDRMTNGTGDGFPANIFIGLATGAAPAENDSVAANEITAVDTYVRKQIGVTTNWSAATKLVAGEAITDNVNEILFDEATGSWGTITYALLFDALTAGTFLGYGSIASTLITSGDQLRFKVNTIVLKLT
jgi:hypothetical protein